MEEACDARPELENLLKKGLGKKASLPVPLLELMLPARSSPSLPPCLCSGQGQQAGRRAGVHAGRRACMHVGGAHVAKQPNLAHSHTQTSPTHPPTLAAGMQAPHLAACHEEG